MHLNINEFMRIYHVVVKLAIQLDVATEY